MTDDVRRRSAADPGSAVRSGVTTYDAKDPDTKFPPIKPLRPPAGAPNVLIILHRRRRLRRLERLRRSVQHADVRAARGGRAQVQPLPHHGALLAHPGGAADGRNHHRSAWAASPRSPRPRPATARVRPNTSAPLAETLSSTATRTAQFGKCHEVPVWETSPMGPFDRWPRRATGSSTSTASSAARRTSTHPALYRGHRRRSSPTGHPEEGYHFTEDMTDRAIELDPPAEGTDARQAVLRVLRAGRHPRAAPRPDRVVATSTRAPFDDGWDALREETFARQKELGVIPPDAELTARPAEIPAWDDMPDDLKPVLARQMEVYAGFLEHTDHHVGRLLDALAELGILDDTLVYCIIGDNGARPRARSTAPSTSCSILNGAAALETTEFMASQDRPLRDARGVQPLRGRLGARHGHARTSGPSRSPRTGAAHATARSCTGRTGSRRRARSATSSTTSSTSRRPSSRRPACRRRPSSTASSRRRSRASRMAYSFDDATAADRHDDAVLRDVRATAASTTRAGPR